MTACIPLAIQVVIDDVGWWSGADDSAGGGPFRSGCTRDHVLADYKAIVELGERLGMRPQAAMVLCEWDRVNLLRDLPSSTWMGAAWDNARWQGPWLDEVSAFIRDHAAWIELAVHGIGHEFWEQGLPSRAEWHDQRGRMRPEIEVRAHMACFAQLLEQHALGPFPRSFVPAAFLHRFGGGLAPVLAEFGMQYISTPFAGMHRERETEAVDFGIDAGVLTVDRTHDLCHWNMTAPEPIGTIGGVVCGMHWPNLLHHDPTRNGEVVDRWVRLLHPYDTRFTRMLAPDSAAGFSQLVYHRCTDVQQDRHGLTFDFRAVDAARATGVLDTFFLKIRVGEGVRFAAHNLTVLDARREPEQWRLHVKRAADCTQGTIRIMERGIGIPPE